MTGLFVQEREPDNNPSNMGLYLCEYIKHESSYSRPEMGTFGPARPRPDPSTTSPTRAGKRPGPSHPLENATKSRDEQLYFCEAPNSKLRQAHDFFGDSKGFSSTPKESKILFVFMYSTLNPEDDDF